MSCLAHDACLRAGEVLALRWSDITWEDFGRSGTPRVAAITIRCSKARYTEGSETVRIPRYRLKGKPMSAVHLLWVYMRDPEVLARQQGDTEGYLFPSLTTTTRGTRSRPQVPVAKATWVRWVHQQLSAAGFDAGEFAGHSFRAGGATDLHNARVAEVLGRLLGRWRSRDAYLLYLRQSPTQQAAEVRAGYQRAFEV
jgi:integrase